MRVRITRRGGLAGIPLSAELDTASFDAGTAGRMDHALETLMGGAAGHAHPDAFDYEIVLLEQGRTAHVSEQDMPPQLEPLLRELTAKGQLGLPGQRRSQDPEDQ